LPASADAALQQDTDDDDDVAAVVVVPDNEFDVTPATVPTSAGGEELSKLRCCSICKASLSTAMPAVLVKARVSK